MQQRNEHEKCKQTEIGADPGRGRADGDGAFFRMEMSARLRVRGGQRHISVQKTVAVECSRRCGMRWCGVCAVAGALTHKNKNKKGKIKNELLVRLYQEVC